MRQVAPRAAKRQAIAHRGLLTDESAPQAGKMDFRPCHQAKLLLGTCESGRIGPTANPSELVYQGNSIPPNVFPPGLPSNLFWSVVCIPFEFMETLAETHSQPSNSRETH